MPAVPANFHFESRGCSFRKLTQIRRNQKRRSHKKNKRRTRERDKCNEKGAIIYCFVRTGGLEIELLQDNASASLRFCLCASFRLSLRISRLLERQHKILYNVRIRAHPCYFIIAHTFDTFLSPLFVIHNAEFLESSLFPRYQSSQTAPGLLAVYCFSEFFFPSFRWVASQRNCSFT